MQIMCPQTLATNQDLFHVYKLDSLFKDQCNVPYQQYGEEKLYTHSYEPVVLFFIIILRQGPM